MSLIDIFPKSVYSGVLTQEDLYQVMNDHKINNVYFFSYPDCYEKLNPFFYPFYFLSKVIPFSLIKFISKS